MKFNESQIKAVSHTVGPALVLAGPGSGKTTVITHRIKKLIESDIMPEKILVVTFTRAAAVHMQKKFFCIMNERECTRGSYPVAFGTFHSIYYRILKLSAGYRGENILSGSIQRDIIKEIVIRNKIQTNSMQDFIDGAVNEIGYVKGNMIQLDEYIPRCCSSEEFKYVFREYENELRAENKLDFDDIVQKCFDLLMNNPILLQKWQKVFEYILIDEFQDINAGQYAIIKMLSKPDDNLFIVGDDDQSIYGFRGAGPNIMFDFRKDYPDAEEIILNTNYRSSEEIVNLSQNLIVNNRNRFDKSLVSAKGKGVQPEILKFRTQYDELAFLCGKINECLKKGISEKDIAVLVRNNNQIPMIQSFLNDYNIHAKGKRDKNNIYNNEVGKDIIAYMKSALTYNKTEIRVNDSLVRIINKPQRLISRQVLSEYNMDFYKLKKIYAHNKEIRENIMKLEFDLKMISKLNPDAAMTYLCNGVGYEKYLTQYAKERKVEFVVLKRQMNNIKNDCVKYRSLDVWVEEAEKFEESHKSYDIKNSSSENFVNIITMHSAKGLEFEAVFIPDVNQGVIPTSKAVIIQDFEEERRLFYVALTRAKRILGVYAVTENLGCEVQISMFIDEILKTL